METATIIIAIISIAANIVLSVVAVMLRREMRGRDEKVSALEDRLSSVESRMTAAEHEQTALGGRLDTVIAILTRVETKLEKMDR